MNKKEAYEKKFEAQLDEWKAEADILRAKADKADAEVRIKYHEQIQKLQTKQQEARNQAGYIKKRRRRELGRLEARAGRGRKKFKKCFSQLNLILNSPSRSPKELFKGVVP